MVVCLNERTPRPVATSQIITSSQPLEAAYLPSGLKATRAVVEKEPPFVSDNNETPVFASRSSTTQLVVAVARYRPSGLKAKPVKVLGPLNVKTSRPSCNSRTRTSRPAHQAILLPSG